MTSPPKGAEPGLETTMPTKTTNPRPRGTPLPTTGIEGYHVRLETLDSSDTHALVRGAALSCLQRRRVDPGRLGVEALLDTLHELYVLEGIPHVVQRNGGTGRLVQLWLIVDHGRPR